MRLTPGNRLEFQDALFDTRESSRLCYLCIPLLVREDFDADTTSADNMSEGNGLGEIAGDWRIYALRVHYRNVDNVLMAYGHIPPGVEVGDALVNFGPRDVYAFRQAMESDNSYLLVDGIPYRIVEMVSAGMGQEEEFCVDARRFAPDFRADGY